MLRVTDRLGLTVCKQFVAIHNQAPERESDRNGARSGTLSLTELMHPLRPTSAAALPCAEPRQETSALAVAEVVGADAESER